ncbi:MAG TPA: ABC transporter substrate-binding protein [Thermomicrobiales bacterium]|nr:ABC transporter substrate-binding protein [Thermomicrobiales bacterium]
MGQTREVSRRQFLAGAAGAATALLLAACGASSSSNQNSNATLQAVAGNTPAATTAPTAAATTASTAATAGGTATVGTAGSPAATSAPAGATGTSAPAAGASGPLKQVARNRTFIHCNTGNQLTDYNVMNPFLTGLSTADGYPYFFEAPYYYNSYYTDKVCGPPGMPCKDGFIPWQLESYDVSPDFTQYTFHVRKGVEWSDGQPFTANDIAYTINMLKDNADKMTWGIDMKTWVKDATAKDDMTAVITLTEANPRFFFKFFQYHQDIGVMIQPQHIWKDQDPTTFNNFDLAKGYPVSTGPWKLVLSTPQQRIFDRRDDWWAAKTGFHPLPNIERIIVINGADETKIVQLAISNEIDMSIDLRPNNIEAVIRQNPKITTWTGNKPPYGYRDWWPVSLGFNDMKAPFDDPDIRWAINYCIDRKQIVSLGYHGAGEETLLPLPKFPALQKYIDAVQDQAAKIEDFDLNKSAATMQKKGYTKNGDGLWTKDGKTISMVISCPGNLFQDIAPIVSQQLRKGGFDASFKLIQGPEYGQNLNTGNIDAFIQGHGGSVRDPYDTLALYHSRYSKPTGQQATQPYRWVNADYDKIVDQMSKISPDDPQTMDLFKQAMAIWIPALPDIGLVQWFHRIPTNTTYWTAYPDENNPYINSCFWHRTSPLWINTIKPAQ